MFPIHSYQQSEAARVIAADGTLAVWMIHEQIPAIGHDKWVMADAELAASAASCGMEVRLINANQAFPARG